MRRVLISIATILGMVAQSSCVLADSFQETRKREDAVLGRIRPILSATAAIKFYYRADCEPGHEALMPFPELKMVDSAASEIQGLEAFRNLFGNDKRIAVREDKPQIYTVRVDNVPEAILATKIGELSLSPLAQLNPDSILDELLDNDDLRAARRRIHAAWLSVMSIDHLAMPAPALPSGPLVLRNMTVEEILDRVAVTSRVAIFYGVCSGTYTGSYNYYRITTRPLK